jgi:hypothetical protein
MFVSFSKTTMPGNFIFFSALLFFPCSPFHQGRVSARRLSIYNYSWGLLKATKIVYLVRQMWKGAKNLYLGYPAEFAGATKNPVKNYQIANSTYQNENFPNKSMIVP